MNIQKIFSGDQGTLWFEFTNSGSAFITSSNPDRAPSLALALAAKATGKSVIVRYAADGVACNSGGRTDLVGLYLLRGE